MPRFEQAILDTMNGARRESSVEKSALIREWRANERAFLGRRSDLFLSTLGLDDRLQSASVRINYFQLVVRFFRAKLLAQRPRPIAIPDSSSDADRRAASAVERYLRAWARSDSLVKKEDVLALYVALYGSAFRHVQWNPDGEGPNGGLVDIDVVDPYRIFAPASVQFFEAAPWCMRAHILHVDDAWRRWGVYVEPSEGADEPDEPSTTMQLSSGRSKDFVTVYEWWEKPSRKHSDGRHYVATDKQVLEGDDNLPDGIFPVVMCRADPIPGCVWGQTPLSHARPIQALLNRIATRWAETMEKSGPKFLIPNDSVKTPLSHGIFEQVRYNRNAGTPQILEPGGATPQLAQFYQQLQNDLRAVVGADSSSFGQAAGDASGRAIRFMAEEANVLFGLFVTNYRTSMAETAALHLGLVRTHATQEQIFVSMGSAGGRDVMALSPQEIRFRAIEWQSEASDALTKETLRQTVMQAAQMGFVSDPSEFRRLLEIPSIEGAFGGDADQQEQAQNEEQTWEMLMEAPDPSDLEDHAAHLECHVTFARSDRFRRLPRYVQVYVMRHVVIHQAFMGKAQFPPDFQALTAEVMGPAPMGPVPPETGQPGPPEAPGAQPSGGPMAPSLDTMGGAGSLPPTASSEAAAMAPQANLAEEAALAEIRGPA